MATHRVSHTIAMKDKDEFPFVSNTNAYRLHRTPLYASRPLPVRIVAIGPIDVSNSTKSATAKLETKTFAGVLSFGLIKNVINMITVNNRPMALKQA